MGVLSQASPRRATAWHDPALRGIQRTGGNNERLWTRMSDDDFGELSGPLDTSCQGVGARNSGGRHVTKRHQT